MAKVRSAASAFAVSLVILGLAFAGATGLALWFYTQAATAQAEAATAKENLAKIKGPGDEARAPMTEADTAGSGTLLSRVADVYDKLSKEKDLKEADLVDAKRAVSQADAEVKKRASEIEQLKKENESSAAVAKARLDTMEQDLNAKTKEMVVRTKEADIKIESANQEVKSATENLNAAIATQQAVLAGKDQQMAAKEKELAQAKKELELAQKKIREAHQPMSSDVAMPNGIIAEVLPNGDAYIKLGAAERVRLGMNFEVFQANSVIHMQAGNTVIGKATLEVYRVERHDCIARVVRGPANLRLLAGDPIINLAYSPHGDVNFVVYGAFDINNTKNPNVIAEDETRIKALIASSGGQIIEIDPNNAQVMLSPDVDYLVLGKQPNPPLELAGDDATDVGKMEAYKKAQKDYALYTSLMGQARQMQIPVLNQNRFLELMGFYHRSKVKLPTASATN